jgi:TetR/AcrR family transcriptional regulator, mexJK operon transcriptional repressor
MANLATVKDPPEVLESAKAQRILEAARQVFLTDGYGATSMDTIAKAAGVSKATVYAHFSSKDRLFSEIIAQRCRRHFPNDLDAEIDALDPKEALRTIGQRFAAHVLAPEVLDLYRIVVAETPRFPELGRALYEGGPRTGCARMARYLQHLVDRGVFDIPNTELAARQFFSMIRGDLYMRRLFGIADAEVGITEEQTIDGAVEVFWRAYSRRR